jgi:hypothetical protein
VRCDRTGVLRHEVLDDRQAEAEAAAQRIALAVGLDERLEDASELIARDPAPGVAHGHPDAVEAALDFDVQLAAGRRELGRVHQQVAEHLGEPHRIALEATSCSMPGGDENTQPIWPTSRTGGLPLAAFSRIISSSAAIIRSGSNDPPLRWASCQVVTSTRSGDGADARSRASCASRCTGST